MKNLLRLDSLAKAVTVLLFTVVFTGALYGQTYTTIANGNWNSAATWQGGSIPPTASEIPASAVINIRHTVAYNTGNPIKNRGEIRIQPAGGSTATLNVPTNINVENLQGGKFYIISGSFLQCRFTTCNDGQPYSGTNPQAAKQSGTFKNIGGYVEVRNSIVEVAQDWTSESGGTRLMVDSCVTTGQNFSISGAGSTDSLIRMHVSIGWHGSGNFQLADGTVGFDRFRLQLAGTSGSFQLNSGTASGDIDYITLRNHIVPFIGTGEIFASSSLVTSGINLDAYCVSSPSKYIPNGKFTGTRTPNCSLNYFPAECSTAGVTAAGASISGRVTTASGRGISKVVVEISGGELTQPVRVKTGPFGYFTFDDLPVGQTYVVTVQAKRFVFSNSSRVVGLLDNVTELSFVADEEGAPTNSISNKQK